MKLRIDLGFFQFSGEWVTGVEQVIAGAYVVTAGGIVAGTVALILVGIADALFGGC